MALRNNRSDLRPRAPSRPWQAIAAIAGMFLVISVLSPVGPAAAQTPTPSVLTLNPTEDAYVGPDITYNSSYSSDLRSDGSPLRESYLKFDLRPLSGESILSAKLRMFVTNGSGGAHNVKTLFDNNWGEVWLYWANRPEKGSTVVTFTPGSATGVWREIDVTSAAVPRAGALMSLAIDTASADAFHFNSSNAVANRVALIVQYGAPSAPPPPTLPMQAMSIDMNEEAMPANSATALGSREACARINENNTLDADEDVSDGLLIDITAAGIPPYDDRGNVDPADDLGGIIAYAYYFNYPSANLTVQAKLADDPAINTLVTDPSSLLAASEPLPDDNSDDSWASTALDHGSGTPESGDGVLDRLTLVSDTGAPTGASYLSLIQAVHLDASGAAHLPLVTNNAVVAINEACVASPVITPPPTPTPNPSPAAGISFQGATTTVNTTPSVSLVIATPPGTGAGDVLIASLAINGPGVWTAPAGWVQMAAVTTAVNPKLYAYYRVASAAEPAGYTWSFNSSAMSSGGIARYAGVDTGNPLDAPVSAASSSTIVPALTVPAVTTTSPRAMLVGAAAINSSKTAVLITGPDGMTERWDVDGKRQEYDDALRPAVGGSGDRTWTFSASRAAAAWLAALRPAQ